MAGPKDRLRNSIKQNLKRYEDDLSPKEMEFVLQDMAQDIREAAEKQKNED